MKIVGLTGGIGSGKSLISEAFKCLNVPVYNSDKASKALVNSSSVIISSIKKEFGSKAYKKDILDRKYIASIVFNDQKSLNILNSIIHPEVKKDFESWARVYKDLGAKYIIKETAILVETGLYQEVDFVVLVKAKIEDRIKRVISRDGSTQEEVQARIKKQMPDKLKQKYADAVIENNNDSPLLDSILSLHKKLIDLT